MDLTGSAIFVHLTYFYTKGEVYEKWTKMAFRLLRYIVMVLTDYAEVIPLHEYTNEDLIEKQDELSLVMLINKLRNSEDFKNLKEIPEEYFDNLNQNTPDYLLRLISKIVSVFLYKLNLSKEEVDSFTDQIERREFGMLFDSFEAYDVQETRRVSREEGKREGLLEGKRETLLQINQLNQKLLTEKRYDDLERATQDPEYQEQLLKEFGL